MKIRILGLLFLGVLLLPVVTDLFNLEARRRGGVVIISTFTTDPQTTISPN